MRCIWKGKSEQDFLSRLRAFACLTYAHLEDVVRGRCIRDLEEHFAKVPISASKPIVTFRETVTEDLSDEGTEVS